MSTSYSAFVIFGYCLPQKELLRIKPNPLWGKYKFNPDTGELVPKNLTSYIELALENGECLRDMTRFIREDTRDSVLLGVKLTDTGDLTFYGDGGRRSEKIELLSDVYKDRVAEEVKTLLAETGITFNPNLMGYYLVGRVF